MNFSLKVENFNSNSNILNITNKFIQNEKQSIIDRTCGQNT